MTDMTTTPHSVEYKCPHEGSRCKLGKAIELGFADDTLKDEKLTAEIPAYAFSGKAVQQALVNKITAKARPKPPAQPEPTAKHTPPAKPEISTGRSVDELMERLNLLKY